MIEVRSADGHVAQLEVSAPTNARTGLLWIPAMGVPARKYSKLAGAMSEAGVAVALHEWRGAERSNWRAKTHDWSYDELLADIAASRAALDPSLAWHVGGHSLGAQLAALALAAEPARFESLAVVGSGTPWWGGFPVLHRPFLLGVFAFFRGLSAACGYFPGDKVGFGAREARGVIRDWTRSGLRGAYGDAHEAKLRELTRPVSVVRFSRDWYVPEGSVRHLLSKMPKAPSETTVLPGDHFAWMREPAAVARVLAGRMAG